MYLLRALMEFNGIREGCEDVDFSGDPGVTHKSFAEECDINTIVKRFGVTGTIPVHQRVPLPEGVYEDFDFRGAQEALIAADKSFMTLPAEVRARFANDPIAFAEYAVDRDNLPQMRLWGLATPEVVAEPVVKSE